MDGVGHAERAVAVPADPQPLPVRIRERADDEAGSAPSSEATSRVAKLSYIDYYLSNKFAFCRFNFTTGDAADAERESIRRQ